MHAVVWLWCGAVSNLLAFGSGPVVDKAQFRQEVVAVRHRLKTISRRTINPRSRFVRTWDLLMVSALVFTALVTPFEVAFFEPQLFVGATNFALNRV